MTQNLHSHKINNRKNSVHNFKTVVQSQVELESCKVEKLDVSIRPLFANPVTYKGWYTWLCDTHIYTYILYIQLYSLHAKLGSYKVIA